MKMLGQDIVTQEEFDAFSAEQFAPVKTKVELLKTHLDIQYSNLDEVKSLVTKALITGGAALIMSVIALILVVL